MLATSCLEFLVRAIPETFLFIFAVYAFSNTRLDIKKYLLSSVLMCILGFGIRLLPIHYGVHTILVLIFIIILTININKIDTIKTIQAGIITVILQFICEAINVLIIQYVFVVQVDRVFNNPNLKILYGIPSTLIFAVFVSIYYFRMIRRKS